jgi:hypothetical protein
MHRHVHIREDGVDSLSKSRTQAHSGGYHSVSATGDTSSPAKSYSDDAGLMGGRSFIAGIMRRVRVWNARSRSRGTREEELATGLGRYRTAQRGSAKV